jgi:modulator of FtsH protease
VSIEYDAAPWANFFVAEVGASAALVGLLFVAVSINLTSILELPSLPGRAFEALVILMMLLLVGTFGLVPGQSTSALGIEVGSVAVAVWGITVLVQVRAPRDPKAPWRWVVTRVASTQVATLPMVAAGASLLAGWGGGLYWVVGGVVATLIAAVVDAWVLLIEIRR